MCFVVIVAVVVAGTVVAVGVGTPAVGVGMPVVEVGMPAAGVDVIAGIGYVEIASDTAVVGKVQCLAAYYRLTQRSHCLRWVASFRSPLSVSK